MPKTGITSNSAKFNKNQKRLVERFGVGVSSGACQLCGVACTVASEDGLENINFPGRAEKNVPYKIQGKYIYNPIAGKQTYKKVKEQKDTKKYLVRTGSLLKALTWFKKFVNGTEKIETSEKEETHFFTIRREGEKVSARIGFLGDVARALNNGSAKDAGTRLRGRRRIMELAFSKVKTTWKKSMRQKRLLENA